MPEQLSLFPPEPRRDLRREVYPDLYPEQRLFFALLPDPETSVRLTRFCRERGLKGRLRPFHISLRGIASGNVKDAVAAAKRVRAKPFTVVFDRVGTCGETTVALTPNAQTLAGLAQFQDRLDAALYLEPAMAPTDFKPHLTLLCSEDQRPMRAVEPVTWTVNTFALMRSFVGQSRYELEGRWPLRTDA